MQRPTLLMHCQHALGLGHLARSFAIAGELQHQFDVVFLNGGSVPDATPVPDGVRLVDLPALTHDRDFLLVSPDPFANLADIQAARTRRVLQALDDADPVAVLIEMYPFGRSKFAFELDPLLQAVHRRGPRRPRVLCSVRDILVGQRRNQAAHDERACQSVNRFFDAVLVHSDPRFARLHESFRPATPLRIPVLHTGFVTGADGPPESGERCDRVLVSAGGGIVGGPLFAVAAAAAPRVMAATGMATTIVTGPFLDEDILADLRRLAAGEPSLDVIRQTPDLAREIGRSSVSVSQCGYNTTMDLLRAGTPSVVVPYADGREDEQLRRATRLDRLGALQLLHPADLDVPRLVEAVATATTAPRGRVTLDLDGRRRTAAVVAALCDPDGARIGPGPIMAGAR